MTSPLPTDEDAREALAAVLWEAAVSDNPEAVPGESWAQLCEDEPEWAGGYRYQAERALAAGFRRSMVSPPSDDERVKARQLFAALVHIFMDGEIGDRARELSKGIPGPDDFTFPLTRSVVSTPSRDTLVEAIRPHVYDGAMGGVGWDAIVEIAEEIADAVLSAVSAPPTITDAALQRLREAVFAQSQRERSTGARGSGLYYPSIDAAITILRAALGGEEKNDG